MTDSVPRTEAGMMLRAIFPTRIGFSEQALTEHILAIEAEAAASPAAPAVDVERLRTAMERASGLLNMHFGPGRVPGWGVVAKYIAAEYQRLQDTVDPVAT